MSFSGPMFERSESAGWKSVHNKDGGHYNTFALRGAEQGMSELRHFFPDGTADEMNLVFFSTSGVHGSYCTIEEAEAGVALSDDDEDKVSDVTFLIFHPRLVTCRYGECSPKTPDDFAFLKKLRASSWSAAQKIGAPDAK